MRAKKIRIFSLDYDGCFAPAMTMVKATKTPAGIKYQLYTKEGIAITDDHKEILAQFAETAGEYAQTYVIIGSNRQDFHVDKQNCIDHGNGSCFIEIKKIADHLGATFLPVLMADISHNLKDGTSYERAINPDIPEDEHLYWDFDKQ